MSCHNEGGDSDSAIHNLCGRLIMLEEQVNTIKDNDLVHIQAGIDRVEEVVTKMSNRGTRPTWTVVIFITFLTSMCVGLIVGIIT